MSFVSERFLGAVGAAAPRTPSGLHFESLVENCLWEQLHKEIGAGFFLDGFLYLFGEGLQPLLACLPPWSFLVPTLPRPMIVGYNAFGSLLVVKDHAAPSALLGVLDPARVMWSAPADLDFQGLVARWIPGRWIPYFLDHAPYDAWRAAGGRRLAVGEMLSMKTPAALGGKFVPENFEITDIVRFYQESGPGYAKTVVQARQPQPTEPQPPKTQPLPGKTPAPKKRKGSLRIGKQIWAGENLDVEHYRNGDKIPHAASAAEWKAFGQQKKGCWCWLNDSEASGRATGRLYNWFAVNDPRGLAPEGWAIPNVTQWKQLIVHLNGSPLIDDGNIAGEYLKSEEWKDFSALLPDAKSDSEPALRNESGFTALPGGYRLESGEFVTGRLDGETEGVWWSATEPSGYWIDHKETSAWVYRLSSASASCERDMFSKASGCSVRCLQIAIDRGDAKKRKK